MSIGLVGPEIIERESNQLAMREQVILNSSALQTDKTRVNFSHHIAILIDSNSSFAEKLMAALKARSRLKNLLLFIPNMILLCGRLLTDARVPKTEKALVAGAIVYAIIPLDLIPD